MPASKKLNTLKKQETIKRAYRFRVEVIDALAEITNKINLNSNIKISMTNVIELLILNAKKNPSKIIDLI